MNERPSAEGGFLPAFLIPLLVVLVIAATPQRASAQEKEKIGPFAVDIRGALPRFDQNVELADSRGLALGDLPGFGLGFTLGAHWYPFRWRAITFGIGGELLMARAHHDPTENDAGEVIGPAVTERMTSVSPQISFNFGSGRGWSYLSGGIGPTSLDVAPDDATDDSGSERLKTLNYGGGARWFAKPHLAFALDVRFYALNPGEPHGDLPPSPRMTQFMMSFGISLKK